MKKNNNHLKIFLILFIFLQCENLKKIPPEYRGSVVFFSKKVNIIGDSLPSLSNSFNLQGKLGLEYLVTDYSIKNSSIRDWLGQTHRAMEIRPEIIILELGTNDALLYGTDGFADNLLKLIGEIKNQTAAKLILTAVPPTNIEGARQAIAANNQTVKKLSAMYNVVDLESLFYSYGDQKLYSPIDSLHPNDTGMDLIGNEYALKIGF